MHKLVTILALYVFPGLAGLTLVADGYRVLAERPIHLGYVVTTLASGVILGCHARPSTTYNSDVNITAMWFAAGFVMAVAAVATHPLQSFAMLTSAVFVGLAGLSLSDLFQR